MHLQPVASRFALPTNIYRVSSSAYSFRIKVGIEHRKGIKQVVTGENKFPGESKQCRGGRPTQGKT